MNGVSGREFLRVLCEANGYVFDVQEVTDFQERRLTGPISNRESFRVSFAKKDALVPLVKDDMRFLVEIAAAQRLIPVFWYWNAHPYSYEVRIFSREVFSMVVGEFENIATHAEKTFDYYQENAECVGLAKDLRTAVRKLNAVQLMCSDLSENLSGEVHNELENFIFKFEASMDHLDSAYPAWRTLSKEANDQLYDSFQLGTAYAFLRKIVN